MTGACFLDAFAVKGSRQNLDCRDILLLRYLAGGGKESLDMVSVLSLGPERLSDEVS
jgi:hypothetical protein